LGSAALVMGLVVLWGLKQLELWLPQHQRATLTVALGPESPPIEEVCRRILSSGYRLLSLGVTLDAGGEKREARCELEWRERPSVMAHLPVLEGLAGVDGVLRVEWMPGGLPAGSE
jgi:putative Mg2+ transporter-C (MgtC) family protein